LQPKNYGCTCKTIFLSEVLERNTTKIASSLTQTMWETMEEEVREIMTMWPDIIRDVTEHIKNIPDVDKWLEKVSHY
jgi:hypothetical protein